MGTEYFVIDEALANARPDLVMSGRTVSVHRRQKASSWKTIILDPSPKGFMPSCGDYEWNH